MGIAGLACVAAGLGLLLGLLIGAALLRAAVSIANRVSGPLKQERFDPVEDWDWDDEPEDPRPRRTGEKAIPEPAVPKAMMIASTTGVVNVFIGLVLAVFAEALDVGDLDDGPAVVLFVLFLVPLGCAATALLLTVMLPTTFWRAALVSFVQYALVIVFALVAVAAGYIAWHLAGG
jgi:hypothetical protein